MALTDTVLAPDLRVFKHKYVNLVLNQDLDRNPIPARVIDAGINQIEVGFGLFRRDEIWSITLVKLGGPITDLDRFRNQVVQIVSIRGFVHDRVRLGYAGATGVEVGGVWVPESEIYDIIIAPRVD